MDDIGWILFPAVAAVGYAIYFFGGGFARTRAQLADSRDPGRRWAHGVFRLISGEADYAYSNKGELRRALAQWWGIENADDLRERIAEFAAEEPHTPAEKAWCWVRAVNLTRMGVGARYLSYDESWRLCAPFLPRIQAGFSNWEELARAYLEARDDWVRERNIDRMSIEVVENNVAYLREHVWPRTAFSQPLHVRE